MTQDHDQEGKVPVVPLLLLAVSIMVILLLWLVVLLTLHVT